MASIRPRYAGLPLSKASEAKGNTTICELVRQERTVLEVADHYVRGVLLRQESLKAPAQQHSTKVPAAVALTACKVPEMVSNSKDGIDGRCLLSADSGFPVAPQAEHYSHNSFQEATPGMPLKQGSQYTSPTPEQLPPAARVGLHAYSRGQQQQQMMSPQTPQQLHSRWRRLSGQQTTMSVSGRLPAYMKRMLMVQRLQQARHQAHDQPEQHVAQQSSLQQDQPSVLLRKRTAEHQPSAQQQQALKRCITDAGCRTAQAAAQQTAGIQGMKAPAATVTQCHKPLLAQTPQHTPADQVTTRGASLTDVIKETPLSCTPTVNHLYAAAAARAAVAADHVARGVVPETPMSRLAAAAISCVVEPTPLTAAGLCQATTTLSGRTAIQAAVLQVAEAVTSASWGAAPPSRAPSTRRKPVVGMATAVECAATSFNDDTGHNMKLPGQNSRVASLSSATPAVLEAANSATAAATAGSCPPFAEPPGLSNVSHAKREQWWAVWQQQQQTEAVACLHCEAEPMDVEAAVPGAPELLSPLSAEVATTCAPLLASDCSVLLDVTQSSLNVSVSTQQSLTPAVVSLANDREASDRDKLLATSAGDMHKSASQKADLLLLQANQPTVSQMAPASALAADLAEQARVGSVQTATEESLQPVQSCDSGLLQQTVLPATTAARAPAPQTATDGTAVHANLSAVVAESASKEAPAGTWQVEQTQSDVCATLGTMIPMTLDEAFVGETPTAMQDVTMQDAIKAADDVHVQVDSATLDRRLKAASQAVGTAAVGLDQAAVQDFVIAASPAGETCAVHDQDTAVAVGSASTAPAEEAEAVADDEEAVSPAVGTYGSDCIASQRSIGSPVADMITTRHEGQECLQHEASLGQVYEPASSAAAAAVSAAVLEAETAVAGLAQPVLTAAGGLQLAITPGSGDVMSPRGQRAAAVIIPSSGHVDPVLGIDLEAVFFLAEQFEREIQELHGNQIQLCSHLKGAKQEQQQQQGQLPQVQQHSNQLQQQQQGQLPEVQQHSNQLQYCQQQQQCGQDQQNQRHSSQDQQQPYIQQQQPEVCSLDCDMLAGLTQQLQQDTTTTAAAAATAAASPQDDIDAAGGLSNSAGCCPSPAAAAAVIAPDDEACRLASPDLCTPEASLGLLVEPPGLLSCAGVTQVPVANGTPQMSQTQSCLQLSPEVSDLAFHDPANDSKPCPMVCESFPFQKDAVAFAAWCNEVGPAAVAHLQQQQRGRNFGSFHERQQFLQRYMQQYKQQHKQQLQGDTDAGAVLDGDSGTTRAAVAAAAAAVAASERLLQGPPGEPVLPKTAAAQFDTGGCHAVQFPWVRVFTEEYAGRQGYTRRFLAASYQALWRRHQNTPPNRRHLYEVIQDGYPCHLYFDIEYNRAANPDANGDQLVNKLLGMVRDRLLRMDLPTDVTLTKGCILELDSSTAEKFSRHVIVRVPGHAFRDNQQVGAFVRSLVSDQDADFLYLAKHPASAGRGASERACMVDTAVYTKNRHFRLLGSSKGGKQALLQPTSNRWAMSAAQNNERHLLPPQLFLISLICNVHPDSVLLDYLPPVPAVFQQQGQRADGDPQQHQQLRHSSVGGGGEMMYQYPDRPNGGPIVVGTEAPVGRVSSYRSIKASWGPLNQQGQGQQQVVAQTEGSDRHILDPVVLQDVVLQSVWFVEDVATRRAHGAAAQVRTVAYCGYTSACSRHCAFAFSLIGPGSHMCANVGRSHKNNHVFYVVDFAAGVYCQKCHDPDCWGFRSPWLPLPQDVWQRERLLGH